MMSLAQGQCDAPYAVLGWHKQGRRWCYRTWQPQATTVTALAADGSTAMTLSAEPIPGLFVLQDQAKRWPIRLTCDDGAASHSFDAWQFRPPPQLQFDVSNRHRVLGARIVSRQLGQSRLTGAWFSLWAPAARAVYLVGSFNGWDDRRQPMQRLANGCWWAFVPGAAAGDYYKFVVTDCHGQRREKSDSQARAMELAPGNASRISNDERYRWRDQRWRQRQRQGVATDQPMAVYELHAGSWRRHPDGRHYSYTELADALIPYLLELGYSHLEFLPLSEHPFSGSWGYQPVGLYAATARFGSPADLKALIDRCHRAGIAVILDWVPAHFPRDEHGLVRFDGTALYEHPDPRRGEHPDWQTLIYDYSKPEVCDFLINNALYWLQEFHFDGLRIDAVASMLYLDYSRGPGQWLPNARGGRENDDAVAFFQRLHRVLREHCPGQYTIAEESTAWPGVTRSVESGGLGFDYKWNMGWMHDSLRYLGKDPIHRRYHHGDLSFGLSYAFSEQFVLALSHDEVVHGKGSMLGKCPGDNWQQFANLRAYYGFQYGHPGKKSLFMGGEFGQRREWNHDRELDWFLLADPAHKGLQRWLTELNRTYKNCPALWQQDFSPAGFEWIEADAADTSLYAFIRWDRDRRQPLIVLCNFTPVVRHGFRLGVPGFDQWRECLNSDAAVFGGSDIGNAAVLQTDAISAHGRRHSIMLELPPLATVWLMPVSADAA
ncbi:1,4-alpha-glucan branching protein GlgB [Permianibacter sp. IMCC34836]|nr:1,4-alpha-glucan branching protein GlgB [Permianibacter fluminis]